MRTRRGIAPTRARRRPLGSKNTNEPLPSTSWAPGPVESGGRMAGKLTDEARELAQSVRDRAREAFFAARAQTERSDDMRTQNRALKERLPPARPRRRRGP